MVQRERGATWPGDEDNVDWSRLSRLVLWGTSAAVAMALAAIACQTEIGSQRLAATFAGPGNSGAAARSALPTAAQLVPQFFDAEGEARRLSEAVRLLTADRDRLLTRITTLERNLDDMTGSIARETAAAPGGTAARAAASPLPPESAMTAAPPSPATAAAAGRAANLPAIVGGDIPPAGLESTRTEFGADIGSAPTMDGLRTLWSVVRSNFPQYVESLRPVVAVRETRAGAVELRLVVGPLANTGAAARLCANLVTAGLNCQATVFEGQRLALR